MSETERKFESAFSLVDDGNRFKFAFACFFKKIFQSSSTVFIVAQTLRKIFEGWLSLLRHRVISSTILFHLAFNLFRESEEKLNFLAFKS